MHTEIKVAMIKWETITAKRSFTIIKISGEISEKQQLYESCAFSAV
jgi:hypothetical protein